MSYGESSWKTNQYNNKNKGKSFQNNYMKLKPGKNIVRIFTKPFEYACHSWKMEGDTGFGRNVKCAVNNCPLCELGDKAKSRWVVGVIDRESGQAKILDIKYGIFSSISTLAESEWGSPENYDISITKTPNAPAIEHYKVVNLPPKVLSAEDNRVIDEFDMLVLNKLSEPSTRDKVLEKMKKIEEEVMKVTGTSESKQFATEQKQLNNKPKEYKKPNLVAKPKQQEKAVQEEEFKNYDDDEEIPF